MVLVHDVKHMQWSHMVHLCVWYPIGAWYVWEVVHDRGTLYFFWARIPAGYMAALHFVQFNLAISDVLPTTCFILDKTQPILNHQFCYIYVPLSQWVWRLLVWFSYIVDYNLTNTETYILTYIRNRENYFLEEVSQGPSIIVNIFTSLPTNRMLGGGGFW